MKPASITSDSRLFRCRRDLAAHCAGLLGPRASICEVGVRRGDFSIELLEVFHPSQLLLVDIDISQIYKSVSDHPRVKVVKGISWEVLARLPDDSLDYLYVDGDHSRDGVYEDVKVAHLKVRPGGIIQFNDYTNWSVMERQPYGVLDVVNDYIESNDAQVVGLSLERAGYHDLAMRVKVPAVLNYP